MVAEPTANYPYVGHKGLVWFEIETTGVTAHGSMPEVGDNAIIKMARVIGDLEGFRFPVESHPVMGSPTLNVGTIRGGLNTNSVPDSAKITVDVRTVPGIDHGHLCHSLEHPAGARAARRCEPIVDTPSLYTEPADDWVQEVFEVCTPFLDGRPAPKTITFSTDGAWLKPGYGGPPAVILGPGEPKLAHQTDEWCSAGAHRAVGGRIRHAHAPLVRHLGVPGAMAPRARPRDRPPPRPRSRFLAAFLLRPALLVERSRCATRLLAPRDRVRALRRRDERPCREAAASLLARARARCSPTAPGASPRLPGASILPTRSRELRPGLLYPFVAFLVFLAATPGGARHRPLGLESSRRGSPRWRSPPWRRSP